MHIDSRVGDEFVEGGDWGAVAQGKAVDDQLYGDEVAIGEGGGHFMDVGGYAGQGFHKVFDGHGGEECVAGEAFAIFKKNGGDGFTFASKADGFGVEAHVPTERAYLVGQGLLQVAGALLGIEEGFDERGFALDTFGLEDIGHGFHE